MNPILHCCTLFFALLALPAAAAPAAWPGGARVAVSLSYDDALSSQLDHALPALEKYQIKASFYLRLASPVVADRLEEWRSLAAAGHELGNHTLFHPCAASRPGRQWVRPHHDLDHYSFEQISEEVATANAFLRAIDGRSLRTYTPPCLDHATGAGEYLPTIKPYFVAIKGAEGFPEGFSTLFLPEGQSGKELIAYVKNSAKKAKLIQIIFHGVGGDHLAVSAEAHEQLLKYLAENRAIYWTDTYLNIMSHLKKAP